MSVAYYKRKDGSEVRREKLFFRFYLQGIQNKLTFEGKFLSKVNYHIV